MVQVGLEGAGDDFCALFDMGGVAIEIIEGAVIVFLDGLSSRPHDATELKENAGEDNSHKAEHDDEANQKKLMNEAI